MAIKQISDAELAVMRLLWQESPLTLAQIRGELLKTTAWNHSTIKTLVFRLRDKGVIEPLDKYGAGQYVPLVTEDEYVLAAEKAVLDKFGSAKKLAMAMVRNGHLTDADIEELRDYFRLEGERNG
ncbi:MAG: BlaI/MecI/CopY family transcriptional regulator [Clostridiales Family XIII bacterium]|jgi:BlaI family penicillinase repressor|nr:BlaI/MecI/CopY family transcriptional regulator [Clostridiales Family XIII bacterium]